ncbi:nitroreductase family deazaflavin-dependent oxidoreductase [Lysinimonas soli]|uniref:Nitroreductase family deazaflavin-dependent oxidoreductase n=1 Tax=Lysinimonas soli TaxID=1074233 RepID=A0ABW0NRC7_9MICO
MSARSLWLAFIKRTVNPLAVRSALRGRGPFSIIEHIGRVSGRRYRTPIIVAPVAKGFVAELTYGPKVAWYLNSGAAGGCVLRYRGSAFRVDAIDRLDADAGLRAYGAPRSWILRLLRRHDFLLLHVAGR